MLRWPNLSARRCRALEYISILRQLRAINGFLVWIHQIDWATSDLIELAQEAKDVLDRTEQALRTAHRQSKDTFYE